MTMLSKYLLIKQYKTSLTKSTTVINSIIFVNSSNLHRYKLFATSSNFDNEMEYEIDLISLKKTPKKLNKKFDLSRLDTFKKPLIDSNIVLKSINEVKKQDPLDNKQFRDDDNKGYLDFVETYYNELQVFLKFLDKSYNGKIKSFSQLTSIELLNSLYIFKDCYLNNKIEEVTKYNYISYNYMFERLLKYLTQNPQFPDVLSNELLPIMKDKQILINLYKSRIGNFIKELKSLSEEFDFNQLSTHDLSNEINNILVEFNKFLRDNSKFDKEFFKVLIQINRYKYLKKMLDTQPDLELKHLLLIVNDPDSLKINTRINQLSEEFDKINKIIDQYKHEINFINIVFYDHSFKDFSEFAAVLYEQSMNPQNDELARDMSNKLLDVLLPLYGEGLLSIDNIDLINDKFVDIPIKISHIPKENYEITLIYNFDIFKNLDGLKYLKSVVDEDFANLTDYEILNKLNLLIKNFNGNSKILHNLKNFKTSLENYFEFISWDYSIFDKLIGTKEWQLALKEIGSNSGSVDLTGGVDKISKSLTQSPITLIHDFGLDEFSNELKIFQQEELDGFKFGDTSPEVIQSILVEIINKIKSDNRLTDSKINVLNLERFENLSKRLNKVFEINNSYVAELDEIVNRLPSNAQYTQIPDDLELHTFSKELEILRTDELKKFFKDCSVNEIISILGERIEAILNDSPKSNPKSRLNKNNISRFNKLGEVLARLFNINGGYTEILDTIILNQSVFENFERKKLIDRQLSSSPYRQVPDDFLLEEYMVELVQLRSALGVNFKDSTSSEILKKVNEIINIENNLDKNIIWRKLYRNLVSLFKINNDNPFVLDNVLISGEQFMKFDSDMAFNKLINKNSEVSVIGENSSLINESFENIEQFLIKSKLINKNGIWKLTEPEFNKLLNDYSDSLDSKSYDYPIALNLIDRLKQYNMKIEYYPNFLQQLFEIKLNNLDKKMSSKDVEDIYKVIIENIEYEKNNDSIIKLNESTNGFKQRIAIPIDQSKTNKFNINEFEKEPEIFAESTVPVSQSTSNTKTVYNDSEKLLSILIKNESPVDLDSNELLKGKLVSEKNAELLKSELDIKDAVSVALNNHNNENMKDIHELKNLTNATDRESHEKKSSSSNSAIKRNKDLSPTKIDKSSLESFLQNAKNEKELAKERKFRETKAYEWSKSMYNSHRSLESHNFFNPLYTSSTCSSRLPSSSLFFPKTSSRENKKENNEYLLLSLDGQTIKADDNPLGETSHEDIFKILNKFNKKELNKLIKNFKKLQKKNWKLIGSKIESNDQKYFILVRRDQSADLKQTILTRVKTIFATTGVVFVSLMCLNLWLDESTDEFHEVNDLPENTLDYESSDDSSKHDLSATKSESSNSRLSSLKILLWNIK